MKKLISREKGKKHMKKNGFTIIEVIIVFLVILGVTFMVLPQTLDNTQQANYISKWKAVYANIHYMFSVIKAQNEEYLNKKLAGTNNKDTKEEIIIDTLKPYLRIKSNIGDAKYEQYYMNKKPVEKYDQYYVEKLFLTKDKTIVGIKWLDNKCNKTRNQICGYITFDINGLKTPNTWGKDIFGVNIFSDRIEPIGKNVSSDMFKNDCSDFGHGMYCSYYYLIGGQFE